MRPTAPIQQGAELARGSLGCCHHRALPPCQLRLCHRASLGQLSNLLAKQPLGGGGGAVRGSDLAGNGSTFSCIFPRFFTGRA